MSNSPKVSLIIPVYNVEQYLVKCLESAINQTLQDIEIIIVNDGSTDNSYNICKSFADRDRRITLLVQNNGGLSAARNSAIKVATGEFLAFLDSDDYIDHEMLEGMYNRAHIDKLDIVICRYEQVDEKGKSKYISSIPDIFTKDEHFRRILSAKHSAMACDKLVKRKLFHDHDIWYSLGLFHEDVDTTYKLFYFADSVGVVEEPYYKWLVRPGSISKSVSSKHREDFKKIITNTKNFLIQNNVFEEYKKEYMRKGVHFLLGLIDRVSNSSLPEAEKTRLCKRIWKDIKRFGLEGEECVSILKQYNIKLHKKLISRKKEYRNSNPLLRRMIKSGLPPKSRRRKIVKQLLKRKI